MHLVRVLKQIMADCVRSEAPAPMRPEPAQWPDHAVTAAWLGHATVLVNFFGIKILTDPVFLSRVGIRIWPLTLGPKRYVECALSPGELPDLDLILLSHAHMDHLDLPSLRLLSRECTVITARHTADIFSKLGFRQVLELDWGKEHVLQADNGELRIGAKRLKHWGARTRTDTHRRYNAYLLERNGVRICFAGDTARTCCSHLAEDGPIDLMLLPIGAYHPWIQNHCTPEEAVEMANEAGATHLLPIHHQTFRLSWEPMDEPISRFQKALHHSPHRVAVTRIGETFQLPLPSPR